MEIISTRFEDAFLIETKVFADHRGYFMESYNESVFAGRGISCSFVQDNLSVSKESGTLRGLHYQLPPYEQTKLVRVVAGVVMDVIVDIRKESRSYGKWQSFILSSDNYRQLLVPKGFAHGFCTLAPNTTVLYKVDRYYSAPHDRGILWNDADLAIDWPTTRPVLSEKDSRHPTFQAALAEYN